MVFKVPESDGAKPENRFEFEIGGKTYDVPKLGYVPGTVIDMLADAERRGGNAEEAAQYALFGEVGTPVGDAVRTLDLKQLQALLLAYQEESRITAGESSASDDS